MKTLKTTAITGIWILNLIGGIAFASESTDNPFLRERAKELAQQEPEQGQVDDGDPNSNPFASPTLKVICGSKSTSRSEMKFKVDNSGKVHGLKTQSGTQVAVQIRTFTSKSASIAISMKNVKAGQSISVSPILVAVDETSVGGGEVSTNGVIEMNGELCVLFYSN